MPLLVFIASVSFFVLGEPVPGLAPDDARRFAFTDAEINRAADFATTHAAWACGPMQDFPFLGRKGGAVWYQPWRRDALFCEQSWAALRAARQSIGATQLEALRTLRRLIGDEAYQIGLMPPMAPWWYFFDR